MSAELEDLPLLAAGQGASADGARDGLEPLEQSVSLGKQRFEFVKLRHASP